MLESGGNAVNSKPTTVVEACSGGQQGCEERKVVQAESESVGFGVASGVSCACASRSRIFLHVRPEVATFVGIFREKSELVRVRED